MTRDSSLSSLVRNSIHPFSTLGDALEARGAGALAFDVRGRSASTKASRALAPLLSQLVLDGDGDGPVERVRADCADDASPEDRPKVLEIAVRRLDSEARPTLPIAQTPEEMDLVA